MILTGAESPTGRSSHVDFRGPGEGKKSAKKGEKADCAPEKDQLVSLGFKQWN